MRRTATPTTTPSSWPTTTWSETDVTWTNRPDDGTVAPGNPILDEGGDIRASPRALGSAFIIPDIQACNRDPEPAGNQTKVFPTNDFNESKSFAASKADLIGRVATERAGDTKLSIELYNPNCERLPGGRPTWRTGRATGRARRPTPASVRTSRSRSAPTTTPGPVPSPIPLDGPVMARRPAPSTSSARPAGTSSPSNRARGPMST